MTYVGVVHFLRRIYVADDGQAPTIFLLRLALFLDTVTYLSREIVALEVSMYIHTYFETQI